MKSDFQNRDNTHNMCYINTKPYPSAFFYNILLGIHLYIKSLHFGD